MPNRVLTLTLLTIAAASYAAAPTRVPSKTSIVAHSVDIPLPGPPVRFDYESFDSKSGRLYISHMSAGHVVVFDTKRNKVIGNIGGCPGSTGVLYVPELGRVYSSASAAHEVVAIEPRTFKVVGRVGGIFFPDGIAYAPEKGRLFVSDEAGGKDVVIDGRTNRKLAAIDLGGEAGNTQYDPASHRIYVNVQTRNEVAVIDPNTMRIVGRYRVAGGKFPHGLLIDPDRRLAFIACEQDAKLLTVDLRTMNVTGINQVGDDPDVLAFDPVWRRLYVASESGVVSVFDERNRSLRPIGEIRAPNAHSVAVDPASHRIYLPLKNVHGQPVLRIIDIRPPIAAAPSQ